MKAKEKRLDRLEANVARALALLVRKREAQKLSAISQEALALIGDDDPGELVMRYQDAVRATQNGAAGHA